MLQEWFKSMSLTPKRVQYKLMVAFSLMSLIPLLILGYLATNYIFPENKDVANISLVIGIAIFIAILGLSLVKGIVDPIAKIANHAKIIANSDNLEQALLDIKSEDEIGDLSDSLNEITRRIKDNMDELKNYGEKAKQINFDIHKKVLTLSGLLQIGNLISAKTKLDEILELIVDKVSQVLDTKISFLINLNQADGQLEFRPVLGNNAFSGLSRNAKIIDTFLKEIINSGETFILDAKKEQSSLKGVPELKEHLGVKNLLLLPVTSRGKVIGLLGAGNTADGFIFNEGDIDLVKVFIKQIAIAVENDQLLKKAQDLEIKDELTDLYNAKYIRRRLDEEIKRAILLQRPCSFILVNIDNFRAYHDQYGELVSESTLKKIARILEENTTEIDRVARFSGDEFALVLPEKNKKEAKAIAEEVRKRIEESIFLAEKTAMAKLTISAGVSENPIDGITANDLVEKAIQALGMAKSQGKNRVAV